MTSRRLLSVCALGALLVGQSALASENAPELSYDPVPPASDQSPARDYGAERAEWLDRCRAHYRDNGVGGAVIGGVIGGLAGNRIAGKGNRTTGTVAGAAVGAVTGAAIDKAEDRDRVRDACEDYIDQYSAYYSAVSQNGGYPAYGAYPGYYSPYGYGAGYMMVPVRIDRGCCCDKREVVEEVVDAPVARRVIPRRPADKRIKVVPDKRLKYTK